MLHDLPADSVIVRASIYWIPREPGIDVLFIIGATPIIEGDDYILREIKVFESGLDVVLQDVRIDDDQEIILCDIVLTTEMTRTMEKDLGLP
jgi:hypothetical protein